MTTDATGPKDAQLGPKEPVSRAEKEPAADYTPPRTELEAALADMWSDRLNVSLVGVHDDFFELGGHSILATQILVDVEHLYGTAIPARTLFLAPTVAELAQAIEGAQAHSRQESAP
ncbi:phosphopantetheine-binding protein [Streptomyces sp. NPDC012461]|uniref:Carrier domain-containing protein n=2 Tax=unclassified Streptomyces TaxID=2593676 RepID=A0A6G3R1B4_9ACTN|nr:MULTISPECIES: phosphopantetheine-binding protein [unclassified Streptomyces]NEA89431.1 hypothetical protein [Streptomyces sp. SID14436]NEC81653.1 hypothetical protein [Streptomyces sp. SID7958]